MADVTVYDRGLVNITTGANYPLLLHDNGDGTYSLAVYSGGGVLTNLEKSEDAAHSSGDKGVMTLAVRKDTAAALAGTDGDYIPLIVDASGRLYVQPQGAAADGAAAVGGALLVGGKDGSGNAQTVVVRTPADGDAVANVLAVGALGRKYNGATTDLERNNTEGTLLASAARTTNTNSSDVVNYNARGVILYLNVTVASGTGGLTVFLDGKDPVSGQYMTLTNGGTAITATGVYPFLVYPGAATTAGNVRLASQVPVPRTWRAKVLHGDSSSYTYSLGYALIL